MSQDPDFDRIYRLLDVDPEDGWTAIQQAYRRKAQTFHPDRASGNPVIEKIAAKRFEELTNSFEHLKRFYRIFGDLPPREIKHVVRKHSEAEQSEQYVGPARVGVQRSAGKSSYIWILPLATLLLFMIAAFLGLLLS